MSDSSLRQFYKGLHRYIQSLWTAARGSRKRHSPKLSPRPGFSTGSHRGGVIIIRPRQLIMSTAVIAVTIVLVVVLLQNNARPSGEEGGRLLPLPGNQPASASIDNVTDTDATPAPLPAEMPVLDLSGDYLVIDSAMLRINEPTVWGDEVVFSAGDAGSIDEPVLTSLFVYNTSTHEEQEIAKSSVQFGEIYEGRINDDWIVWLDTDQRGLNFIYALERRTGQIQQIKKCSYRRPQLQLYGDNLVWVEQISPEEDRLYLVNFRSGEPVVLDSYQSTTYGTSPPSVYEDVLVWAHAHPDDMTRSIIKRLNLKEALTISSGYDEQDEADTAGESGAPDGIEITILPVVEDEETEIQGDENGFAYGLDPDVLDPRGFAIYPATNGRVIAWLDHLNPSQAVLKLLPNKESGIVDVAEGVGRIYGIGDTFVVYMQENQIMLYFWEIERYARLTSVGELGRLADIPVSGNQVVWYDANDPSRTKDFVRVSTIQQPSGAELE